MSSCNLSVAKAAMMMMIAEGRRTSNGGNDEGGDQGQASTVVVSPVGLMGASLDCDAQPEGTILIPSPKLPRKRGSGRANSNGSSEQEGSPGGSQVRRRSSRLQLREQQKGEREGTVTTGTPEPEASKDVVDLDSLQISDEGEDTPGAGVVEDSSADVSPVSSSSVSSSSLDLAGEAPRGSGVLDAVMAWESRLRPPMLMAKMTNIEGKSSTAIATRPLITPSISMLPLFNNRAPIPKPKPGEDQEDVKDLVAGVSATDPDDDGQVCSAIAKRVGTPPNASTASEHLDRYASLAPYTQAICLAQDLERQAALYMQSMKALQADRAFRDTLLRDNEELRESLKKYQELSERERQRAEQVSKKLATTQLHNSVKLTGAEQQYFTEQKFSDKVEQIKKEYKQRLKQIENNRQPSASPAKKQQQLQQGLKDKDRLVKFQKGLISMLVRVIGKLAGDEVELELEAVKRIVSKPMRQILGEDTVKNLTNSLEDCWEEEDQLAESVYNGLMKINGNADPMKRCRDEEELEDLEEEEGRPAKRARIDVDQEDQETQKIEISENSQDENLNVEDQADFADAAGGDSNIEIEIQTEAGDHPDLVEALFLAMRNNLPDELLVLEAISKEYEAADRNDEDLTGGISGELEQEANGEGEAEGDAGSGSSSNSSDPPSQPQEPCDTALLPRLPVKIEVNPACHRYFNKLMNTPLDNLLSDRTSMVVFPSIFSVEDVALSVFATIAQTNTVHPVKEEMVQDDRLTKTPLTLRFATLLAILRDLPRLYRVKYRDLPQEFCKLFCQKIVNEDEGSWGGVDWMENEKLLSNLGGFFAALHNSLSGAEVDGVDVGDVILTVGGVKGPLLYSFLYGILLNDFGVLGCNPGLTSWGDLPLWVRSILVVVFRSHSFNNSTWRGRLTELLNSKGVQDLIPVGTGFNGFFEMMLREVGRIDGEEELVKAAKVVGMMVAHRGWIWFRKGVQVLLNRYDMILREGKIGERGSAEGILKGFGLGIAWMRRENLPDNLDDMKSQFVRFGEAPFSQAIRDAAKFSLSLIDKITPRLPNEKPVCWRYDRKEEEAGQGQRPASADTSTAIAVGANSSDQVVEDEVELVVVGQVNGEKPAELLNLD